MGSPVKNIGGSRARGIAKMSSQRMHWKRPVSRIYHYNLEVGENYYHPMTNYLDSKTTALIDAPGALSFSERLAQKWIRGRTEYSSSSSAMATTTTSSSSTVTTTQTAQYSRGF